MGEIDGTGRLVTAPPPPPPPPVVNTEPPVAPAVTTPATGAPSQDNNQVAANGETAMSGFATMASGANNAPFDQFAPPTAVPTHVDPSTLDGVVVGKIDTLSANVQGARDSLAKLEDQKTTELTAFGNTLNDVQKAAFSQQFDSLHASELAEKRGAVVAAEKQLGDYLKAPENQAAIKHACQANNESDIASTSGHLVKVAQALHMLAGSTEGPGAVENAKQAQHMAEQLLADPVVLGNASAGDLAELGSVGEVAIKSAAGTLSKQLMDKVPPVSAEEFARQVGDLEQEMGTSWQKANEGAMHMLGQPAAEGTGSKPETKEQKEKELSWRDKFDTLSGGASIGEGTARIGVQVSAGKLSPQGLTDSADAATKRLTNSPAFKHSKGVLATIGTISAFATAGASASKGDWTAAVSSLVGGGSDTSDAVSWGATLAKHAAQFAQRAEAVGEVADRFSGGFSAVGGVLSGIGDLKAWEKDNKSGHLVATAGDALLVAGGLLTAAGVTTAAPLLVAGSIISLAGNRIVDKQVFDQIHGEAMRILPTLGEVEMPNGKRAESLTPAAADYLGNLDKDGAQAAMWSEQMGMSPEQIQSVMSNPRLVASLRSHWDQANPDNLKNLAAFVATNFKGPDGKVDAAAATQFIDQVGKSFPDSMEAFFNPLTRPHGAGNEAFSKVPIIGGHVASANDHPLEKSRQESIDFLRGRKKEDHEHAKYYDFMLAQLGSK